MAFVMDLSGRRLSSRGLTEALGRLEDVLDEEEEHDGVVGYLPRPLELSVAQNDLSRFQAPPAGEEAEEEVQVEKEPNDMMSMLMGASGTKRRKRTRLEDRLEVLDASQNRLALHRDAFAQFWRLTSLDLSSNRLETTVGIASASSLTELYLRDNRIREIEGLGALKDLGRLDLAGNLLSSTSALRPLAINSELYDLDVSRNPLPRPDAALRLLRQMLPKLRRVGESAVIPSSKKDDTYADIKQRHTSPIQPAITSSSVPRREVKKSPSAVSASDEDDESRVTSDNAALSELPWRQPPNPVPRWMLERTLGREATTALLRSTTTSKIKKKYDLASLASPKFVESVASSRFSRDAASSPRHDVRPPPPARRRRPVSVTTSSPPPPPEEDDERSTGGPANVLDALEQIVRYQQAKQQSLT